jgi:hypothetical protein
MNTGMIMPHALDMIACRASMRIGQVPDLGIGEVANLAIGRVGNVGTGHVLAGIPVAGRGRCPGSFDITPDCPGMACPSTAGRAAPARRR